MCVDLGEQKDDRARPILWGVVTPIIILGFAVWNVAAGEIWWPVGGRGIGDACGGLCFSYHDGWRVGGVAVFKSGISLGLFAWFGLANWESVEYWTERCGFVGVVLMVSGFMLAVVGFF